MAGKDPDIGAYAARGRFESPIIFLYGSDEAFVSAAFVDLGRRIAAARGDLGPLERASAAEVAADPSTLGDFFSEIGLFGDNRFLAISDVAERLGPVLTPVLAGAAPTPGPLLLLASHSLKSKSKLIGAARACAFCELVSCYEAPLSKAAVAEALSAKGVSAGSDAALELIHRKLQPEDPASRAFLIEQLALYAGGAALSEADVAACLPTGGEEDVTVLAEALLSARPEALLRWRRRGGAEGTDVIQQLSLIARALSDIRRVRVGGPGAPVFWRVDKAVKAASMRLEGFERRVETALGLAYQAELAARRAEALSPERTERLLLRLAQIFA